MNFLNNLRIGAKHIQKCRWSTITSSSTVNFNNCKQMQTTTSLCTQENIIAHLCQKFGCTEKIANDIYKKFPVLQSIDNIKNDSLQMLQNKISIQSIIENPLLITMDIDNLKPKIKLLEKMEPKQLDDFAPLLNLDEEELSALVNRLNKEKDEIKQGNRIYYLSEVLKVEPKVISKYRAHCGYEIFFSTFRSFRKKLNVVLDYGAQRKDILKGLYALRCSDHLFVSRSERMFSIGLPIKLHYYQWSDEDFDELIKTHANDGKLAASKTKLKKRNPERASIVKSLKSLLQCDESEAAEIYYSYVNEISELHSAKNNIQYLLNISISRETILENGFLLTLSLNDIKQKLEILKQMLPKKIEDFIPLMCADSFELSNYKTFLECHNSIGLAHPIYYFSEQLNIPPEIVAGRFAESKQVFFELEPYILKTKLNILLKYDVEPMSILNCKTTFKQSDEIIQEILCKLQSNGIDKISSWMIFSSSRPDHEKLILDHKREKTSLEGFNSNMEYISYRLGWDEFDMKIILRKYPKLSKCSASKMKEHLDYFLNETQFSAQDITHFPYIFNRNIDEIKLRVVEMKRIGAPITLPMLYQGKTKYLKYIQKYCATPDDFRIIENRLRN